MKKWANFGVNVGMLVAILSDSDLVEMRRLLSLAFERSESVGCDELRLRAMRVGEIIEREQEVFFGHRQQLLSRVEAKFLRIARDFVLRFGRYPTKTELCALLGKKNMDTVNNVRYKLTTMGYIRQRLRYRRGESTPSKVDSDWELSDEYVAGLERSRELMLDKRMRDEAVRLAGDKPALKRGKPGKRYLEELGSWEKRVEDNLEKIKRLG